MSLRAALADRVWGTERHTRIRLQQWSVTVAIYAASGVALGAGAAAGWLPVAAWAGWCAFVVAGLALFYGAIRSGWSRRFADPALSASQIAFGVLAVVWGYAMSGPVRSATLLPLIVMLTFGAFSLSPRRMAALTAFALLALGATIAALHLAPDAQADARVDIANLAMAAIMLPAVSVVAGLLGALRLRLRRQRGELAVALDRIHELAHRDELTGLANRRQALRLLDRERLRTDRTGRPFAVALVDIDRFKRINDTHGHEAGDRVLQRFARQAAAALRANDVVARWGGEEFLVLMPETALAAATDALERLRRSVQRESAQAPEPELRITVSAGVAESANGEAMTELVARADRALYAAKRGGRDRVVVAEPRAGVPPVRTPAH